MWYLALYGIFAVWVLIDATNRKMGSSVAVWVLGTLFLGPIILPIYIAKRPLKKGEVREGGTAWNVLKTFAILWTILMAIVSFSAMMKVGEVTSSLDSDAAKAGAGLGIMLGMGFMAAVWFLPTVGAAVLGFLMKKNSIVETGPTGPLVGQSSPASFVNGWAGLATCAFVALILVVSLEKMTNSHQAVSSAASGAAHKWEETDKTDPMDGTKETMLLLGSEDQVKGLIGSNWAFLCVRCSKGKTTAYVSLGGPVESEYGKDDFGVRTKFDDETAENSRWSGSTDSKALFAPSTEELVKRLEDSKVFLFEFTPFQQRQTAVKFNVVGLREKLAPLGEACGTGI
jgi:hypothetical protein